MQNKTTHLHTLTLPFNGLNVIEASAGTGKTFTLAALYVRIVIGHMPSSRHLQNGLLPSQILVMTFTDAATAELRSRIRERLSGAARFFRQLEAKNMVAELRPQADIFLLELSQAIDEEQYQLAADRLEIAAQWMDDAAIYTIHSWSSRMLKEHAFDSGALFQQSHAQDSEQKMLRATQDYWRQFFYPLDSNQSQAILGIVADPENLLKQLKPYWSLVNKNPGAQLATGEFPQQSSTAMSQWEQNLKKQKNIIQNDLTFELKHFLLENASQKWLKGFNVKQVKSRIIEVDSWLKGFNSGITSKMLGYFAQLKDVEQLNQYHDLWIAFENSATLIDQKPDVKESLLQHAALHIHNLYEQEKKRHAQFDFNDLLKELYKALQNPDARLAKAIAKQYPIALVDEFQDTDPWQYGSLQKIYAPHLTLKEDSQEPVQELEIAADYTESQNSSEISSAQGLIMIGDPKQAIYSFRGADINTYLLARSHANEVYTLGFNYRSNESLVKAVNTIFSQAIKPPFGEIAFNQVQAHHINENNLALDWNQKPLSALTVWHLQHNNGVPNKDKLSKQLADISASHITQLLNNQTVKAGDIAVLVRDHFQASVIREALSKRAVRSVYLSEKESVFDSSEAQDLWRILRAVANPQNLSCVKAALATQLWGLNWQQLEFYIHNEKAWDAVLERFMDWQLRWKKQGVLAMIHAWLHEQNISQRLRTQINAVEAGNERILSNVLHLAELLQNASMHLQSESALVRYLENQIQDSKASGETSLLRLESDENLVKVITMHKSKGLEYPYVYLPFVSLYRKPNSNATEEEIEAELYENIRLLYVSFTRAKTALMMIATEVGQEFNLNGNSNPFKMNALSYLLGRQGNGDLANHLQKWNESEFISIEAPPPITTIAYKEQLNNEHNSKAALINNRTHEARWWTASFSAISKGVASYNDSSLIHDPLKVERLEESQLENTALQDEFVSDKPAEPTQAIANPYNSLKGGADFGTLLHDLLEWQTHQDWILAKVPEAFLSTEKDQLNSNNTELEGYKLVDNYLEWLEHLEKKLASNHIDLMHLPIINHWLYQVLKGTFDVATANPLQLGLLNRRQVWPEMAFTLPIKKLNAQKIDSWVSHFIHPEQSRPALHYLPLEGMMTGFMDLVLIHDNQYFILDYKSNKLKDYSQTSLTEAILHHRYEVQYTLYILALHRLLKARLKDYQYEQHVGGAIYLFLRGINQEGNGLYFKKPSFELINALDLLFKNSVTPEVLLPKVSSSKSGTQASLWN